MELWERRGLEHNQSERRVPWSTPQDPRDDSKPRSTPYPRRASARGRVARTWQGSPRPTSIASPRWSGAPSGHEGSAAKTQGGTTTKKEARSEIPTCSGPRILGLARIDQRESRTTRRWQETTPAQATVTGSREGAGPSPAAGTRGAPDAEAGAHDGDDDAGHVTGPWLWHQYRPREPGGRGSSRDDTSSTHMVRQ